MKLLLFVCCVQPNRLKKANTVHKHMSDICSRDSTVHDLLKKCVDQLQHVSAYTVYIATCKSIFIGYI